MEAGEVMDDFNNVPLMAPLECREENSVSLEAGEEFFDDHFQPEQVTASPSPSEATGGSEFIEEPFIELQYIEGRQQSCRWSGLPLLRFQKAHASAGSIYLRFKLW